MPEGLLWMPPVAPDLLSLKPAVLPSPSENPVPVLELEPAPLPVAGPVLGPPEPVVAPEPEPPPARPPPLAPAPVPPGPPTLPGGPEMSWLLQPIVRGTPIRPAAITARRALFQVIIVCLPGSPGPPCGTVRPD